VQIGPVSITLRRAQAAIQKAQDFVTRWPSTSGWWPVIRESFAGAWQRGVKVSVDDVLSHSTAWACITLIANDIAKMGILLVAEDSNGICTPTTNAAYSPVLRKPNHYQNRIQFLKYWMLSKLTRGNTYVLKARDNRRVVTGLYILDPTRVKPLVSSDGQVFYELQPDDLAADAFDAARGKSGGAVGEPVRVPASEIIHDIYVAPYHPLCGVSPIYACAMVASQGLKILSNSATLFENGSQPGGVLTAPGTISHDTADRIQKQWDANFGGQANIGKVAVLGEGLKFERMAMTAVDAQLIDQLKWGSEQVCSAFHMPKYKVGVGPDPTYNNIEALSQEYYSECLQIHVEEIELLLEEGLAVASPYEIELDTEDLLRMDSATKMKFVTDGVKGGVFTPNEGRKQFNRKPLKGGDTVYLQQQDFSISALDARDQANPAPSSASTAASAPATAPPPPPPGPVKTIEEADETDRLISLIEKEFDAAA
jgi:HK97 family phage portal protein